RAPPLPAHQVRLARGCEQPGGPLRGAAQAPLRPALHRSQEAAGEEAMSSLIATLRGVVPVRPLSQSEAMRVAELQAARLLELTEIKGPPVPEGVIATLPRIRVERTTPIPVSG